MIFSPVPLCSPSVAVDPCSFTECAFYATCIFQRRDGTARCECSDLCPTAFSPVCGSNLRTYWNKCFLKREACFMKQNTSVSSIGPCSKFCRPSCLPIFSFYNYFFKGKLSTNTNTLCLHLRCSFQAICVIKCWLTPWFSQWCLIWISHNVDTLKVLYDSTHFILIFLILSPTKFRKVKQSWTHFSHSFWIFDSWHAFVNY